MSLEYKYLKKKYDVLMQKNNKTNLITDENTEDKLL